MRICKILVCWSDFGNFLFFFTSKPDAVTANGEDTTSSDEEKEDQDVNVNVTHQVTESGALSSCYRDVTNTELLNGQVSRLPHCSVNGSNSCHSDEDDDGDDDENVHHAVGVEDNSVPTIYFSHTVEPKRVRILLTFRILHVL